MKVLIDIGHPAHVHYYRNFYFEMAGRGHGMFVTVKNIPSAKKLLERYSIPNVTIGTKSDHLVQKGIRQLGYDWKLRRLAKKQGINIGVGTSITIAHLSRISRANSLLLDDDDDDVQPLFTRFAHPFADALLSPDALIGHRKREDAIFYSGYHELLYLHPKRFTPDETMLGQLNLKTQDVYFVLRFNAFKAHHDSGADGMTLEQKVNLVQLLARYGKVFITTEREIEKELEEYRLQLEPENIHHLLVFATMFVGDSQTMASEAAVLGTPSLRCNSFVGRIAYLEEEEHKYGLTYGFRQSEFDKMLVKIQELLAMPDLKAEWQRRRQRMLADKIDVTAFLVWFVENYPESARVMRENPEYQHRFK